MLVILCFNISYAGVSSEYKYEDEDIIITAHTDGADIIPEDAELSITPLTKVEITNDMNEEEILQAKKINEQYDLIEKQLLDDAKKTSSHVEGFLAYDISFLIDGQEVEPSEYIKVVMDFKESTIPAEVSNDANVTLKHLKEVKSGTDEIVVEDMSLKAKVETTENAEVEKIEFTSNSFSAYTVVWTSTGEEDGDYPIHLTSHYGYLDEKRWCHRKNLPAVRMEIVVVRSRSSCRCSRRWRCTAFLYRRNGRRHDRRHTGNSIFCCAGRCSESESLFCSDRYNIDRIYAVW